MGGGVGRKPEQNTAMRAGGEVVEGGGGGVGNLNLNNIKVLI